MPPEDLLSATVVLGGAYAEFCSLSAAPQRIRGNHMQEGDPRAGNGRRAIANPTWNKRCVGGKGIAEAVKRGIRIPKTTNGASRPLSVVNRPVSELWHKPTFDCQVGGIMPSIKSPTAAKVLLASAAMFSALAKVLATPFANANPRRSSSSCPSCLL